MGFDAFFLDVVGKRPFGWQGRLGADDACRNRLIRIPTGYGKTAGVSVAWMWHRLSRRDRAWPRRLVLCLPMRTLVDQIRDVVSGWLERVGLPPQKHLHVLMGGLSPSDWHLEPEGDAVLIGTQDMLLSRALNRGYGAGRARWPMEYALLNRDCLWVMDEIQLMGVGLVTSAQLQAFAEHAERDHHLAHPRRTWWMSATLQRNWLLCAPDLSDPEDIPTITLREDERVGALWNVNKELETQVLPAATDKDAKAWAQLVADAHQTSDRGITLVIANTVKSAVSLHKALQKLCDKETDLRLVHSRFRGAERRRWTQEFLSREHCRPGVNRIIVATQVVEAGVDISADLLIIELAPWPSMVQRLGRCARYGGRGRVIVVDRRHDEKSAAALSGKSDDERAKKRRAEDEKTVLPYSLEEIEAAQKALRMLSSVSPAALESLEQQHPDLLPALYPYAPRHVLVREEMRDLFDTSADLSGADIDISRFVREGDLRDVTVWWWPVPTDAHPHERIRPVHDAMCPIPIAEARSWLTKGGDASADPTASNASSDKSARMRAWSWQYVDGTWRALTRGRDLYPGMTILVDAGAGGYDPTRGFDAKTKGPVSVSRELVRGFGAHDWADAADEQDALSRGTDQSEHQYKTIQTHAEQTADEISRLAGALDIAPMIAFLLRLAAYLHDIGKAFSAFAAAICDRNGIAPETHLAKAPKGRWHHVRHQFDHSPLGRRAGLRHELVSTLALLELVYRARPDHPALQGGRASLLELCGGPMLPSDDERIRDPKGILARLVELDEQQLNLVAYVVLCHHGKIRTKMQMGRRDAEQPTSRGDFPLRGVADGDRLAAVTLSGPDGDEVELPAVTLSLEPARMGLSSRYGPSWAERVAEQRAVYGDLQLAWFEALLRIADVRASQISEPLDPRLEQRRARIEPSDEKTRGPSPDLARWIDQSIELVEQAASQSKSRGKTTQKTQTKRPSRKKKTSKQKRSQGDPP